VRATVWSRWVAWRLAKRTQQENAALEGMALLRRTKPDRRIRALKGHHRPTKLAEVSTDRVRYDFWRERNRNWLLRGWCWWYVPVGTEQSIYGFTFTQRGAVRKLSELLAGEGEDNGASRLR
jgi:hypothetical protein